MNRPTLDYRSGRDSAADVPNAARAVIGPVAAALALFSLVTLFFAGLSVAIGVVALACALFALVLAVVALLGSRARSVCAWVALVVGGEFALVLCVLSMIPRI